MALKNVFLNIICGALEIFVFLVYTFMLFWSNSTFCDILTILILLRIGFWPTVCSMMVNTLCALESNVYSAMVVWNSLKILIESSGLRLVSKSFILLLIFVSQTFYIPLNVSDESPVEAYGKERQVEAGLPLPQPEVPRDPKFHAQLHLSFKNSLKFHLIFSHQVLWLPALPPVLYQR